MEKSSVEREVAEKIFSLIKEKMPPVYTIYDYGDYERANSRSLDSFVKELSVIERRFTD